MNLLFRENYWDAPELKEEFMRFMIQLFGLDLSAWDMAGFWDNQYRPFSFFSDKSLVANVCIYSMDMTIMGEIRRVAQISAVATRPEFRRRGLSLKLTHAAMDWARDNHDFFFLFADENAYAFYRQCGFRLTDEYKARIPVEGNISRSGAAKLDLQRADHVDQIYRLASSRKPVSNILGVFNSKLFMFWCLSFLREYVYYISALDILVVCQRTNGLVTIFDIVGASVPSFSEIYPYICDPDDKSVEFLFIPDKLNVENVSHIRVEGNGTHLLGEFPLDGTQFIFPYTCHA